jgi:hypothetical protein
MSDAIRTDAGKHPNTSRHKGTEQKGTGIEVRAEPGIQQTDEIREIAALLQQLTGTKQAWRKKYWAAWQQAADRVGLERVLQEIRTLHERTGFERVEYLLRGPEDGLRICFLEELEVQVREERYEREKAVVLAEADATRVGSGSWDPAAALDEIIARTGKPNGPEARAFRGKWDLG